MTGTRGAIFAEIMDRLGEIEGIDCLELMPSGDPDGFPALSIFDGGHSIVETEAGTTRYQLAITVEGFVEGGDGADAHAGLNALYESVKGKLITEPPLASLVETIDEGDLRTDVAELASKRRLGFALDIDITFVTARGAAS